MWGMEGEIEPSNCTEKRRDEQRTELCGFCSFWFEALPEASVDSSFCVHEIALVLMSLFPFLASASLSLFAFLTTQVMNEYSE